MEILSGYYVKALGEERAAFAARYPHWFLLKHPSVAAQPAPPPSDNPFEDDDEEQVEALTRVIGGEGDGVVFDDLGPIAAEWRVAPLVRRLNAPPKDRIVVGRNSLLCDVVLPFASVSKVHAHFHQSPSGAMTVRDVESSNGTFVNGERVPSEREVPLKLGDRIRLGAVEVEFVDAARFYDVLTAQGG
jgi:hypothetical protein